MQTRRPAVSSREDWRWALGLLLAIHLAASPALATCPPEQPGACSTLPEGSLLPPPARSVLVMQGTGIWNYTCADNQYQLETTFPEQGGSYANLTGGGFMGQFYYKPSGEDAVVLLWRQGTNRSADYGVLTMPVSDQALFNSTGGRPDVRLPVTGCCEGTACSEQKGLPLPPIYIALKANYSEPGPRPLPQSEDERKLPASCDPSNKAQASLAFPWTATFTFYTC